MNPDLVVSCEHGGNRVPARYRAAFRGAARTLAGHAGWDAGAAQLARQLARTLDAPIAVATTTRLLVDPNRSAKNPKLFSQWTRGLPETERERILARYWRPHREAVEAAVRASGRRTILHVSVHSFTPHWNGAKRDVDIGLLYDPGRERERAFVDAWFRTLGSARPDLRLRRNRPYLGISDGMTAHLRKRFSPARYLGIELEVSQRFVRGAQHRWMRLRRDLVESLRAALEQ